MSSKKKWLKNSRLYVIIDREILGVRFSRRVPQIINSGADVIQLRDKISDKENILKSGFFLSRLLARSKKIFIVNDHLDIASIVNSDGLHLGQDDIPVEFARKLLGKDKIIGVSCANLKQAIRAQECQADYLAIGPIFSTSTKPGYPAVGLDLIAQCKKKIKIPFFAIGGINQNNIKKVLSAGARRIVLCQAICKAGDICQAAEDFRKILH